MTAPGEIERRTQNRLVKLFKDKLGYEYLGSWGDRIGTGNVEAKWLEPFLVGTMGYEPELAKRATFLLDQAASNTGKGLYDRNLNVYQMLRYGTDVKVEAGDKVKHVHFIDWAHPEKNHFAIAEEVTVAGSGIGAHAKRPDVVIYVNGIALAVLELKRSTVSVAEGIRQSIDSQKTQFIGAFFSTVQLILAGNDTEGLKYGVIQTPERYYATWKEEGDEPNLLDRAVLQAGDKARFLELIYDFMLFDSGIKKIARPHQYFGVQAARPYVENHEGGIIWHAQGTGKSLTMVWLARWILENRPKARVLIITDRTELDQQISDVFKGVNEKIYRTKSGADLIKTLNEPTERLICSLIHKFGGKEDGESVGDIPDYIAELKKALPADFSPKGEIYVDVDECHRTQSGDLHEAMKLLLPGATFIGFTGTPLLRSDKKRSVEIFGPYIHTYRFDEAVADKIVLDMKYQARDIDQRITSQAKIDEWFEAKTKGLTPLAKAQLKKRWGTMSEVTSSQGRLQQIVADILLDMETKDRLASGRGTAILVAASIYEACKFYELFAKQGLRGKCAIVTSYRPDVSTIKGEDSGEGDTEKLRQYDIYRQMLVDHFPGDPDAVNKTEQFEKDVKDAFKNKPGQMKLLIVVDKLLTGFDAPSATYLYIDKHMRDHGLFQAICRVNRLDTDDKEYGYIVDYKNLFESLGDAVGDYTSGALDGYDAEDVVGLLEDRVTSARDRLEEAREAVKAICEPVPPPRDSLAYLHYFCGDGKDGGAELTAKEPIRLAFYKSVAGFVRAYANIASELEEAGYSDADAAAIKAEANHFEAVRTEVKLHSGDYVDLKTYEPAMRHLIDSYIQAEDSKKVSAFDDMGIIAMFVNKGPAATIDALPDGIKSSPEAVAETIENNVRKLIIDESPINPKYYEKMSELLEAIIEQRRQDAINYQDYLSKIAALAKEAQDGPVAAEYPKALNTPAKRALYDNLGANEDLALAVDAAVLASHQDGWRDNRIKLRRVEKAVRAALSSITGEMVADAEHVATTMALITSQNDY